MSASTHSSAASYSLTKPQTAAWKTQIAAEIIRRRTEAERLRVRDNADELRARSNSLYGFVQEFWPILEPTRPFVGGWAVRAICDHLEAVTRGDIQYLLITVPPGMAKSLLVSVFWPAWEWSRAGLASMRFLTTSYSEANVLRDNQKMRRLVESEKYQALWPSITFAKDQNAKGKFENTETGMREGRAFASMTGGRGDRVIIDDPHSVDSAESDTQRENVVTTFREAINDRLNDMQRSAIVIIMQRLHSRDVAGTILALGLPYVHLNLPMEFEPDRRCVTLIGFEDPRTAAGELLFPERFPRAEVEGLKLSKGSYAYAGQYQQRPAPRDGGMFKRAWFTSVGAIPADVKIRVRAWDLAATDGGGDYTVGVRMSRDPRGIFYVEHVARGQFGPADVDRTIVNTATQDGRSTRVCLPQDPGAAGKNYAATLVRMLAGYDVKATPPTGSKETRATPAASQAEAGNIRILMTGDPAQDAWVEPFLAELSVFKTGTHDDQVDAFADALNDLALTPIQSTTITTLRI
ncbi:MAG: phage terminase large subunit [Alphaproteobacteria bacterium]